MSAGILAGYATVWQTVTRDGFGGEFIMQPQCIQYGESMPCLVGHDYDKRLASTKSGLLRLEQDDLGLHVLCSLPSNRLGHQTRELVESGEFRGMSIAAKGRLREGKLWKVDLREVSITPRPANRATGCVIVRGRPGAYDTLRDADLCLKEFDFEDDIDALTDIRRERVWLRLNAWSRQNEYACR